MQKTNTQSIRLIPRKFSEFCRKNSLLPDTTPLFMVDKRGRVAAKKNFSRLTDSFESMGNFVSEQDFESLASQCEKKEFFAVRLDKTIGKGYIAVSNVGEGLSGCVVCSLSEKGCKKLSEYFRRLCSYRDYLDVFSSKSVTDSIGISAKEVFDSRINGIGYLMNLGSSFDAERQKSHLPIMTVFEKIRAFAEKTNETSGLACSIVIDGDNPAVSIRLGFIGAAVSCLGLAVRNSMDGKVRVYISGGNEKLAVIRIECDGTISENEDIYRSAVMEAMTAYCRKASFSETEKGISMEITLEKAADDRLVVSEPAELDRQLDAVLYLDALSDMFFVITDK